MRTPGDELWKRECVDVIHKLFDNQVICDAKIAGRESQFGECQVEAIHTKRDLIAQLAEIRLLQAGTIANDEGALAFVNIFHFTESPNALAPPRMAICIRKFRDAAEGIVRVTYEMPERLRNDLFESLFHNLVKRSTMPYITVQTYTLK